MVLAKASQYPGHQGVHIIRPPAGDNEYSVIIRYATGEDAGRWVASEDRKKLLDKIADAIETGDRVQIRPGIEFWFTPSTSAPVRAPGWKQWAITTAVIWPLTTLVPLLFDPLFTAVPMLGIWGIRHGVIAAAVVALAVFVVMPVVTRALHHWLFSGH
jgi:uncharacterized protein